MPQDVAAIVDDETVRFRLMQTEAATAHLVI
jgi:hypothetical protein